MSRRTSRKRSGTRASLRSNPSALVPLRDAARNFRAVVGAAHAGEVVVSFGDGLAALIQAESMRGPDGSFATTTENNAFDTAQETYWRAQDRLAELVQRGLASV